VNPVVRGVDAVMLGCARVEYVVSTVTETPVPTDTDCSAAGQRQGDDHSGSDDEKRTDGSHDYYETVSRVDTRRMLSPAAGRAETCRVSGGRRGVEGGDESC